MEETHMLKKLKKSNEKGFTLIELMIVIAIIGILAAIAIPNYIAHRDQSFCSLVESDVRNVAMAATGYLVDNPDLTGFVGQWSNGVSEVNIDLDANGVLTVAGSDDSTRCPDGGTYTIIGGSNSGDWS
jgi:prepilin-type N-terminal cleavage/methylation domain-containing protein